MTSTVSVKFSFNSMFVFFFRVASRESELFQVPDNINVKSNIMKSEEMLSSQMLSGIPEVDLGKRVQLFHEKLYYFKRLNNNFINN